MRFVVDENLPVSLVNWLREQGHQADHVLELGLKATPDEVIARYVVAQEAVIATKDQDFVRHSGQIQGLCVVRLQVGNRSSPALIAYCRRVWPNVVQALAEGETIVVVLHDAATS